MKKKLFAVCVILGLCVLMSGCVEEDSGVEAKMTYTEVRVGDMPTENFSHINVTFSEVLLHKRGNDSGWVNITG